jgi:hypothetical protein
MDSTGILGADGGSARFADATQLDLLANLQLAGVLLELQVTRARKGFHDKENRAALSRRQVEEGCHAWEQAAQEAERQGSAVAGKVPASWWSDAPSAATKANTRGLAAHGTAPMPPAGIAHWQQQGRRSLNSLAELASSYQHHRHQRRWLWPLLVHALIVLAAACLGDEEVALVVGIIALPISVVGIWYYFWGERQADESDSLDVFANKSLLPALGKVGKGLLYVVGGIFILLFTVLAGSISQSGKDR